LNQVQQLSRGRKETWQPQKALLAQLRVQMPGGLNKMDKVSSGFIAMVPKSIGASVGSVATATAAMAGVQNMHLWNIVNNLIVSHG